MSELIPLEFSYDPATQTLTYQGDRLFYVAPGGPGPSGPPASEPLECWTPLPGGNPKMVFQSGAWVQCNPGNGCTGTPPPPTAGTQTTPGTMKVTMNGLDYTAVSVDFVAAAGLPAVPGGRIVILGSGGMSPTDIANAANQRIGSSNFRLHVYRLRDPGTPPRHSLHDKVIAIPVFSGP
jgi:hypothetical protein